MPSSKIAAEDAKATPPLTCGLIMPISPIDGCSAEHWSDVKSIIHEAIESISEVRFIARLVSDADDIGVIQKRIVQGVYNSDVVVCDVSAKNSNVMFELGMRLAFDKPTVIIKDDKTDYSFDTSIIEHIPYPRDLRFSKIINFKSLLAEKVLATHMAAQKNANHSTFLKNFGTFNVAHLDQKEASSEQLMIEMMTDLQREVSQLRRQQPSRSRPSIPRVGLATIIQVLVEMRRRDNDLLLEYNDDLIEKLIEHKDPNLTRGYDSRTSFVEAVVEACAIVKAIA